MNFSKLRLRILILILSILATSTASAQSTSTVEYNGLVFNLFTYNKDPSVKVMYGGDYKEALIGEVGGMTVAENGDIYFTERNTHNIRVLTKTVGKAYGKNYAGSDNGYWDNATFTSPESITNDGMGFLYVVDGGEKNNRIRRIDPTGTVTTYCAAIINTIGKSAPKQFNYILADKKGNIYTTYKNEHAVYVIKPDKTFSVLAGSVAKGNKDGAAEKAAFSNPDGICITKSGEIYVADYGNNAIRKIEANGTVSTVLKGIKAPRRLVEDANGELVISCAEGLVLLKADKSKKLLGNKANRAMYGMHPNILESPRNFEEVKDVCLTISKGIMFFDKNCIRVARVNYPASAATVPMPPVNPEKERLRLVSTTIKESQDRISEGDSVFIVFDYNELGNLFKVTEFIRPKKPARKSNIPRKESDLQFLRGEQISFVYDSLSRPNFISYPNVFTSNGSTLPNHKDQFYRYNEEGRVVKTGSVLALAIEDSNVVGYQVPVYDATGAVTKVNSMSLYNKLIGYTTVKFDLNRTTSESYLINKAGKPYIIYTGITEYDGKKSYVSGFGLGLRSLNNFTVLSDMPISYPHNTVKSSMFSPTGVQSERENEYTYNASGYPVSISFIGPKSNRVRYHFKLDYHTPENDKDYFTYFANAKIGDILVPDSLKPVRLYKPEWLYDYDTSKTASYFLGEWVPAEFIVSADPFPVIDFQATKDRRIFLYGSWGLGNRKLDGIYIDYDDIKKGYLKTVHSMYDNRDNEATRGKHEIELQFFVLKQNVLKVLVRFLHGNRTDQNTEYWIYLTRKDTAFF